MCKESYSADYILKLIAECDENECSYLEVYSFIKKAISELSKEDIYILLNNDDYNIFVLVCDELLRGLTTE